MNAHEALSLALADLAETRHRPPCTAEPDAWTSDQRADLERTAPLCAGCPLLDPCRDAGELEDHGVWGGVIRDRRYRPAERTA